jgi:hypothetical protein
MSKRIQYKRIALDQIDSSCDIQVDAKVGRVVMIFANRRGRKVVEDLWPDVQWTTDEKFSRLHSPDWLFTHIRITRLPPHLEAVVPLRFASPDSLGFAVAASLQRRHGEPRRVVYFSGEPGHDFRINMFDGVETESGSDVALFAEYVPPGITLIEAPETVN